MKKSIIIYADCIAILEELTYEQAGRLFKAILAHVNEEPVTEIKGDPAVNMAFVVLKNQIDRDAEKYQEICRKRSEAGKKHRGNQYTKNGTNGTSVPTLEQMEQNGTNGTDNDNDNDNEVTNVTIDITPNGVSSPKKGDSINFDGLVRFFNETLEKYNSVIRPIRDIKGKRQDAVRARAREQGKRSLAVVFVNAAKSDFLNGKNDRCFIASFDWLVKPNNYIKVLEGNYENITINGKDRQSSSTEQRAADAASIVSQLLAENKPVGE